MRLICLDIETSGLKPVEDYLLLSIATKDYHTGEEFYAEVDCWIDGSSIGAHPFTGQVSSQAMEINQLQFPSHYDWLNTDNSNGRLPLSEIDELLSSWLGAPDKDKDLVPMGLNVGSFDIEYMLRYLPRSAELLGYQSLDLNSVFIERFGPTWRAQKRRIEEWAMNAVNQRSQAKVHWRKHNALFDVWLECFMLAGLRKKAEPWMEED